MKFAFMSFSTPQLTLDEMLLLAGQLGYDGIEPRTASKHRHGIELEATADERRAVRDAARMSGVALCCVATSCVYADPETRPQMIDDTRRYIDLAADVGSYRIRVFGGKIPAGIGREQAIDEVSAALAQVAEHAAARNVYVCMETHDDWCDPVHVAEVMKRVNSTHVAVNWDIMHPVRVAKVNMDHAFETLKPWIRHLHVHDGEMEGALTPIGKGVVDHRRALELLAGMEYDGYLSGEWIDWTPYETHLPLELNTLKAIAATL